MEPLLYILAYILFINLVAFFTMYADKQKAKKKAWRIPEKVLFLLAAIGGSIGSIAGMYIFRHKTKHSSFTIGMPVILGLQLMLVFAFVSAFAISFL